MEKNLSKFLPMQPGDVEATWANIDSLSKNFGYEPKGFNRRGINKFSEWFKRYYLKFIY